MVVHQCAISVGGSGILWMISLWKWMILGRCGWFVGGSGCGSLQVILEFF